MAKKMAGKNATKNVVKKNSDKKDLKSSSADVKTSKNSKTAKPEKTIMQPDKKITESKSKQKAKPTVVANGHLVSIDYVGTLGNGEEFDSSKNHGPIQFVVGSGQVIKGFDTAVVGMKVNDKKKFTIKKHEAYGDVNPSMVQVIPLARIPEHVKSQLKVGGFLVMQAPTGQQIPAKVIKLDKENVSLDMNHPLAGKDLTFDIKIVDINHAPENFGQGHDGCDCGEECGDDCKDEACGPDCGCGK